MLWIPVGTFILQSTWRGTEIPGNPKLVDFINFSDLGDQCNLHEKAEK